MKPRYDLIGDIHGCADQLEDLLKAMGYESSAGYYRHPDRYAIFLGDFIDRGPQQARTLAVVRPMVESGEAMAVLGNHEFNAMCYAAYLEGSYLRPHTVKNEHQHAAFLKELPFGSDAHRRAIDWFQTLPAYLDLPDIGVVHACWDSKSFEALDPHLRNDKTFRETALQEYANPNSEVHAAIECILKGPELPLPEALWFKDKDGHARSHARVRWWANTSAPWSQRLEFGGATLSTDHLALLDASPSIAINASPHKPVFVGHYWLKGTPALLAEKVACVDYSVAKSGKLVAYRWDGEAILSPHKFFWVA